MVTGVPDICLIRAPSTELPPGKVEKLQEESTLTEVHDKAN